MGALHPKEQANPSITDPETGIPPLVMAAKVSESDLYRKVSCALQAGDVAMCELLLDRGADVDARCSASGKLVLSSLAKAGSAAPCCVRLRRYILTPLGLPQPDVPRSCLASSSVQSRQQTGGLVVMCPPRLGIARLRLRHASGSKVRLLLERRQTLISSSKREKCLSKWLY